MTFEHQKKEDIVKRAKEIKQKWSTKTLSEGDTMLKDVHQSSTPQISSFGKVIRADEAKEIGLVNHVFPLASLMDEALKMAQAIAKYR